MTTFTFPALPYAYDALEPVIDRATMEIHHSRHHKAYFDNFIAALGSDQGDLEAILSQISTHSPAVRNNGGGYYNHNLFWAVMTPNAKAGPEGELAAAINARFGSLDDFKQQFKEAGLKQFGSGWVWLLVNREGQLQISSTPNQDNPLMDVATVRGTPILGCDVWEHAYYLHYQNKRADYLENWFRVVNWDEVSRRYAAARS